MSDTTTDTNVTVEVTLDEVTNLTPPKAIKAIHAAVGGKRGDDKAYRARFEAFHPANVRHCVRQCKKGKWLTDDGDRITTLGEMVRYCGELKLANRLLIVQAQMVDVALGSRDSAGKMALYHQDHGLVWED